MRKYKVIKHYTPAHGVTVETGSIVHVSEMRFNASRGCLQLASEKDIVEVRKIKNKKPKIEENGSNNHSA